MTVVYQLEDLDIEFEWDELKARRNLDKHGVPFTEAAEVFLDPFQQWLDASRNDEQRDAIVGFSRAKRFLVVVYIERGVRTRIISARPATRQERRYYEEA
jgi:uncharacterized DUF497 family protein